METKKLRKFGLIGKNIDYSFSRNYFAEKFAREKRENCQYDNFDCNTIDEVFTLLKRSDLCGLNITIPYKEKIIPALDKLSPQAEEIGAVNTVLFKNDGTLEGHNTDAFGFEKSLFDQWTPNTKKALILGTGGASKAIEYVLQKHHIIPQFVSRQTNDKCFTYADLSARVLKEHLLIINATPLGTFPRVEEAPKINYNQLGDSHFLYDLIYNPNKTTFMRLGEKQGAKVANGMQMLIHQAEKAWSLWDA